MRARGSIGGVGLGRLLLGLVGSIGVAGGCGDDGSGDGGTSTSVGDASSSGGEPANAAPVVEAEVDVTAACGLAGATRVELHATRVGCVNPPPAPCTLPNPPRATVGDGVDCPGDASPQSLQVELSQAGRYHVEVLTLGGTDELRRVCFGEDGDDELLVDEARFEAKPTVTVAVLDGLPCS